MRRYSTAILLIVLASIVTGCKSAPDSQAAGTDVPAPVAQSFNGGELSWIFEEPADPVDVAVVLETEGTVEALIPVEGGSISATGADGTVYTLEIPSDALLNETTIGLTPVTTISNMPFGGEQTYAVQLSPEGLYLQNFAILTITPAEDIPLGEQLVFGYQGEGSDLILAAPVADSNEIKINVLHFSGSGVTRGYWGDIEPERRRLGGDIERRLQNSVNEALIRARQEGGDGKSLSDIFTEPFRQYVEQVIKPRVAAAGESCANGRLALETVNSFERQAQLLGFGDDFSAGVDMTALLEKATRACMIEEFEICVEEHVIWRMPPVWDAFVRQYAALGIPEGAALREARDLTVKCLTFKLEFESTGMVDLEEGGYESSVTSELTLRYDPKAGFILGAAAELVNTDFEFRFPCGGTTATGDGIFTVLGMSYEIEYGDPDESGNYPDADIGDLKLVYMPGNTTESVTIEICGSSGPPLVLSPFPGWTPAFLATHIHEMEEGGFVARDWDVLNGELFAEKEWNLVSAEDPSISEEGSFKLYHTPGQ